jgi:hypothetical protein
MTARREHYTLIASNGLLRVMMTGDRAVID